MDRKSIASMARAPGYPVVYAQWKPGSAPPMPSVVYRYGYSRDLMADGANYVPRETWQIELYSESKNDDAEKAIQAAVNAAGWSYEKREYSFDGGVADTTKHYLETLYIVKTIG